MRFDIITIFPEIFASFSKEALISRAIQKQIIAIRPHNLRKWTRDRHKTVDDRPYGGGAGMVLMVEPIVKAIQSVKLKAKSAKQKTRVMVFSVKGKKFDQRTARRYSKLSQLIMICGRYEGIDERVVKHIADEEISIGDYVLFGGEVPAMVVVEAVTRLLPGAVGKQSSLEDESFNRIAGIERHSMTTLVEYPHYTRPEAISIGGRARRVPKVLLSGDHKKIEAWRRQQAITWTKKYRPDLLTGSKRKTQNVKH